MPAGRSFNAFCSERGTMGAMTPDDVIPLVLATPGHTPGHQSVTVRTGDGLVLIVGQAAEDARSFATGPADPSIQRLRELNADRIHFSHDRAVLRRRK